MSAPSKNPDFPKLTDPKDMDETTVFRPKFNEAGLIVAIAADADDGTILMVAHMNAQALAATLDTGVAHYWSRSRQVLWRKGETSGHEQTVIEMRTDCDQDVILLKVKTGATGANCHTGRRSCFYRVVERAEDGSARLRFDDGDKPLFDPKTVYGK